jgi:hypothetical protein
MHDQVEHFFLIVRVLTFSRVTHLVFSASQKEFYTLKELEKIAPSGCCDPLDLIPFRNGLTELPSTMCMIRCIMQNSRESVSGQRRDGARVTNVF